MENNTRVNYILAKSEERWTLQDCLFMSRMKCGHLIPKSLLPWFDSYMASDRDHTPPRARGGINPHSGRVLHATHFAHSGKVPAISRTNRGRLIWR